MSTPPRESFLRYLIPTSPCWPRTLFRTYRVELITHMLEGRSVPESRPWRPRHANTHTHKS